MILAEFRRILAESLDPRLPTETAHKILALGPGRYARASFVRHDAEGGACYCPVITARSDHPARCRPLTDPELETAMRFDKLAREQDGNDYIVEVTP